MPRYGIPLHWGIDRLLDRFPTLAVGPSPVGCLVLAGELPFSARSANASAIEDSFLIEIRIPETYPADLPSVFERGGRIPRTYHKMVDGSLCLGSELCVRSKISRARGVVSFVEQCVVPYLAGYSAYVKTGVMPFGELRHLAPGLLDEYRVITGATSDSICVLFLELLGMKKRVANKMPCPCGSGLRFGTCHSRRLNPLRAIASRAWFRGTARQLGPRNR
jgi:hypothetical protein